jgi:uncharacterized protein YkwD
MILGLGLTTALFRADTIRRSKTDSRHTDLAIRAYGESDGERSQQLLKVLKHHLNAPITWTSDSALNAASWSILRYTEGLSNSRVDGVVPEAMEGAVVTDPLVIPIGIKAPSKEIALKRLSNVLESDFKSLRFNRLGLAAEEHHDAWRLTCLISLRRLEITSPIPQIRGPGRLHIRAKVLQSAKSAEILVLHPNGKVRSSHVRVLANQIDAYVSLNGIGKHKVEVILNDDPHRPQPPAALFTIQVGEGLKKVSTNQIPSFRLLPFGTQPRPVNTFLNSVRSWTDNLRQENGLPNLSPSGRLDFLAQRHAEDLAQRRTLSHLDRTGRNPRQRIESGGPPVRSSGENVAAGLTIEAIKSSLENSPSHRRGMLRHDINDLGVGVAQKDGVLFVVQLFASE